MKNLDFGSYVLGGFTAAAMLAGCGASPPPIGAPDAMLQSRSTTSAPRHQSWMLPEAKGRDLLYLAGAPSDGAASLVYVYSYPRGKRVGTLGGFYRLPGACANTAGDVFFVDSYYDATYEYRHGEATRIATLNTPLLLPRSCSVDPTTGNLAISGISYTSKSPQGGVVIFAYKPMRGWRIGKTYNDLSMSGGGDYCGYDNSGNLYLDGYTKDGVFQLGVLPNAATAFTPMTLNQTISGAGQVQWDGTYLAIGDSVSQLIYQFSISGSSGTVVGSTTLTHSGGGQFWIQGKKLIAGYFRGSQGKGKVGIWPYPSGGDANRILLVHYSSAATVSPAK